MAVKKETFAEKTVVDAAEKQTGSKFSKEQLLKSEQYVRRQDLLNAVLDSNKKYTVAEADAAIEKFMKGRIN